jgi:membrane protein DedA with SNARE-associated domain
MTPRGFLKLTLASLAASVCGLLTLFYFWIANFTHQGNDLDWTFDLGGFLVLWALASGILLFIAIIQVVKEKRESQDH